jgi:8-oxo-dGTP pyrophosphatase MutT (NUDIX family)
MRGAHDKKVAHSSLVKRPPTAADRPIQPTREVSVTKILIKARFRGDLGDAYLMQLDHVSQQYQLIGGHREDTDADDLGAAIRELSEELPRNHFDLGHTDELSFLGRRTVTAISRTVGVRTTYYFTFFHLRLHRSQLRLGSDDRWITPAEIAAGRTSELTPIRVANDAVAALEEGLSGGLTGLAYSLQDPLRPSRMPADLSGASPLPANKAR